MIRLALCPRSDYRNLLSSSRLLVSQRPDRQLRPVLDSQFAKNAIQVFLDRPLRQVKFVGNLLIQLCLAHQVHDLLLPKAEVLLCRNRPRPRLAASGAN